MISLATSCKNRLEFLSNSLPSWKINDLIDEIIILDYDSDIPISNIIKEDEKVKIIRLENKPFYNHSKAKNSRFYFTKNDWVLSIDCDVILHKDTFKDIDFNPINFYHGNKIGCWGTHLINRNTYMSVNGHNEKLLGNVTDDFKFYKSLNNKGFIEKFLPNLIHQNHSNDLRKKHVEPNKIDENWSDENIWEIYSESFFIEEATSKNLLPNLTPNKEPNK